LDEQNGNTRWQDSKTLEIIQLHEYEAFEDRGLGGNKPPVYKMI
jgi:hypothetical protein